MIDKLFESVYNLFEEDEEKINYERSDIEISPVVYSVELYVNNRLQEDYYEKFENKDDAIEYGKKLLNMIGKDGKFTVSVLSYNTESGKIKVEWRETNEKWGEDFFEADENDEMKSILESTGYYDETLGKVSKEDYKELKDEKAVQIMDESISEEAQEKLWKNGFLFDIDQYDLGPESERDYVKSYTDKENNISWKPYLGNEEKDMFYIKGDHSGKLYSLDEIIDIKKGIKKLDESIESIKVGDIFQNEYGTRIIIVVYEPEDDYVMFRIGKNLTKNDLDSASVEAKTTTVDGIKNILNHNGYQPINLDKIKDLNESVKGNSFEVIVFSEDKDGRVNILDEKILDNKESAIGYAKETVTAIENVSYANVYRLDQIENLDTGNFEEDPVIICQVDKNQHIQYLINEGTKDLHKFEIKNWSKDDEKRLYDLSRKNPQEMSDDEWKEFQKLEKRSSRENKKWVKSLSEDTLKNIIHPVQAISIDAIDRIIKKYGYEITDVIDISEQDGNHEYNCMLEIFPDSEHYGKKNLDEDANTLEKILKNKLETNNIKVKHTHDSNGLNVYFYYSESLDEDTVKQNGKWVNKGKEGTHGTFKTKKEADAQRKAMFANGYLKEDENVSDFDVEDTTFLQNSPTIDDENIRERTIQMRNEIANSLLPPEEIEALSSIAFSLNDGTFADSLFFDNPQTPGLQDLGKIIKHKYGEELKNNQENLLNEFRLQSSLRREYYDLLDKYRKVKNSGKNLNTPTMKKNIERLKEIKKSFIESKDKSDVYHENISNIYIPEVKKYIEGYIMKFTK